MTPYIDVSHGVLSWPRNHEDEYNTLALQVKTSDTSVTNSAHRWRYISISTFCSLLDAYLPPLLRIAWTESDVQMVVGLRKPPRGSQATSAFGLKLRKRVEAKSSSRA